MLQEETKRVADAFETLKDNRIVIEGAGKIIDGVPFGKRDVEQAQALSDLKQYLTKGLPENDKEYLETRVKAGLGTISKEDYQVLRSEQIIKSIGTDEEYSLEEDNIEEEPAPVEEEKIVESADSTVAQEQVPEQLNNINNEEIAKIDALSKDEILKMMEEDKNAIVTRINRIKANNGKDEKRYTSRSGMTVSEYSVLSRMISVLNSPQDYKEYRWEEYKGLKKDLMRMDSPIFEFTKEVSNDLEAEKWWVNTRIEEIKAECANRDRSVNQEVIATQGTEILRKDLEEFGTLMNMKKILDNGMVESYPGQYRTLRSSVYVQDTPEMNPNLKNYLTQEEERVKKTDSQSNNNSIPVEPPEQETPTPNPDDDLVEVKEVKKGLFQKIKDNKKKILILAGIAAVVIVVSAAAAFIPGAITALTKANAAESVAKEVEGLAGQMIQNGNAWGAASAADKISLHGANVGLSNIISAKTGIATQFTPSTGVWTMGGKNLSEFAASSSAAVKQAASAVSAAEKALGTIIGSTFAGGIAGALSFGKGLSMVKKKSPKCLEVKHEINELSDNALDMSEEDFDLKSSEFKKKIEESSLESNEKTYLLKKLSGVVKRTKKKQTKQTEKIETQEPVVIEPAKEDNKQTFEDIYSSSDKVPEGLTEEEQAILDNVLNEETQIEEPSRSL